MLIDDDDLVLKNLLVSDDASDGARAYGNIERSLGRHTASQFNDMSWSVAIVAPILVEAPTGDE